MTSMPDTERVDGPILIVDDMPENLEVLGRILGDAGHAVRVANSGAAALRYAALEPRPELILLDIMMPGMDGHEVLRRLRADPATRDIPVLFLTALDDPQDIVAGLRLGAADYLIKPVQAEVVLARVHTQLDAKRARDGLRDQNAALEAEVRRRVAEATRIRAEADRTQAMLARQRELILAAASDAILGLDEAGVVRFANPAASALLGYPHDEMLGRPLHAILRVEHGPEPCPLCTACAAGATIEGQEDSFRNRDGYPLALEFSCRPILEAGRQAGSVVTLRDQGERRRYLEQLERKSNYDDLTGLPNRNLLKDRLAQAIARHREDGERLAVLTLDLDRFKEVNDSLGHAAGDQLLRAAAARLAGRLDWVDTLARLDGDEFVVVAEVAEDEVANRLALPLLAALAEPFRLGERDFYLGGSLGIALHPKDGGDGDTLLRNAVAAMYRAKTAGGNRFSFYATEMNARSLERLDLENGLRRAIERGELVLHYQPQASLRSGAITGVEALVRWQHPERGLLMPDRFIGLAEETGLIVPLGTWVLRTACAQARAWQAAGLPPLPVAVNLSARQFDGQDVTALVTGVLADTGLAPGLLELELTESVMMADAEAFIQATARLKALSVRLAIDDFGTGFSSLAYLRRFAIDRLKIDRSFVADIGRDEHSDAIVLAVISLAHSLGLAVIAEGVETEAQRVFLRDAGCDDMQGFLLGRPLPADACAALLREGVPRLRAGGDPTLRQRLLTRLEGFRAAMRHSGLAVCDADGEPLLQAGMQEHGAGTELRAVVRAALASGELRMTELYRMEAPAPAHSHLDFAIPLPAPDGGAGQAAVVLRTDVGATLYPYLQDWPVPSDSAESLLFRRDGDEVLFLNELRHRPGSALTLRRPLGTNLLAAQALRPGYRPGALIEGVDYRGVAALGVAHPVPGTNWWLLAKADRTEVFGAARRDLLWILFISLTTWGIAATLVVLLFQHRQLRHAEQLRREQADRLQALRLLAAIADNSDDAIYAKDPAGRYRLFNRAASVFTGKTEAEVLERDDTTLFPPEQAAMLMANDRRVMDEDRRITYEETLDTPLGRRTFQAVKGPLHDEDGRVTGMYGIARDISERVEAEAALRRNNEELQRFNRAMVGRELDMVRLKGEVNALAAALGRPPPYDLDAIEAGPEAPA